MGQRGPVKGSKRLQVVKGGQSTTINQAPGKPSKTKVQLPSWLPPDAKRLLRDVATELQSHDLLKAGDEGGLALLGTHYAVVALAMKQIKEDGQQATRADRVKGGGKRKGGFQITVQDPEHKSDDGTPAVRKHPLLSVVANHSEKYLAWAQQYAVTPAARLRLGIKPPKGASKLDKFLQES